MKKLMTLMLGMSLVIGGTALFAQDAPKTDDTKTAKKSKKSKKKKTDDTSKMDSEKK